MSFKVIIPARYDSTRLPGKPLLDIAGKTMIQRVYEAACLSEASEVIVATDDERILSECHSFGAKSCMTSKDHLSGTDRLAEVAKHESFGKDQIVVNVQGDEPLIDPALINQVATNLRNSIWASVASLCESIDDANAVFNPNNVKVVFNELGEALYFSRAPIPYQRDSIGFIETETESGSQFAYIDKGISIKAYYRHIGIYAYRTQFLHDFVTWPPAKVELLESLEQLRALDNGSRIHMALACRKVAPGIDTQQDLEEIRKLFK